MDEPVLADVIPVDEAVVEQTSAEYLGRWNKLISTTNWEKGRIIAQWRQRLMDAAAPVQAYSDEAWARRVGNVTGQHVGRLRRVFERFGEVYQQYAGLFWSHFQAALDWPDAEMWLEGAVQSGWSVAEMRAQRWETLGSPADQKPRDEDIIAGEMDEDSAVEPDVPMTLEGSTQRVEDPDFGDEGDDAAIADSSDASDVPFDDASPVASESSEPVRPFENLPTLPDDLAEAFEAFKLAILNHKLSGWRDIACGEVLAVLDGLKQLALAPAE